MDDAVWRLPLSRPPRQAPPTGLHPRRQRTACGRQTRAAFAGTSPGPVAEVGVVAVAVGASPTKPRSLRRWRTSRRRHASSSWRTSPPPRCTWRSTRRGGAWTTRRASCRRVGTVWYIHSAGVAVSHGVDVKVTRVCMVCVPWRVRVHCRCGTYVRASGTASAAAREWRHDAMMPCTARTHTAACLQATNTVRNTHTHTHTHTYMQRAAQLDPPIKLLHSWRLPPPLAGASPITAPAAPWRRARRR